MKFDKPEISGILVLFIGVGLLAFTFLNAYWLLSEDISLIPSQDLVRAFGDALAPLIGAVIHIMYLGIMGWIGSLLTLRGIPLLTHPRTISQPIPAQAKVAEAKPTKKEIIEKPQPTEKPEASPKEEPKKEKEPEKKPAPVEPEKPAITIEVRPPEEVAVETPQKQPPTPQQTQA